MNKIFKVVFNHARGIFMVVNELVKAHGKTKSAKKAVVAAATAVALMAGAGGAMAP